MAPPSITSMSTIDEVIQTLRLLTAKDFRQQLEHDEAYRVSRFILVTEFIQDAYKRHIQLVAKDNEN